MSSVKDVVKGIEGLVVHSEVYERLNNPSVIDDKLIRMCYEKGRKQGALKELKRLYKSISVYHAEDCIDLKLIENRIKELEGVMK